MDQGDRTSTQEEKSVLLAYSSTSQSECPQKHFQASNEYHVLHSGFNISHKRVDGKADMGSNSGDPENQEALQAIESYAAFLSMLSNRLSNGSDSNKNSTLCSFNFGPANLDAPHPFPHRLVGLYPPY